jgi:hypothetical protein
MSDFRITILQEILAARRGDLEAAVDATSPQLRDTLPFAGGWSVAMVFEHLAQTEAAVTKLLARFAETASPRDAEEEFDSSRFARYLDMPVFLDRTRKLKLSQPSGSLTATEAWNMLTGDQSRAALRARSLRGPEARGGFASTPRRR